MSIQKEVLIKEKLYNYWMGSVPKFKTNKIEAILGYFGSPKEAFYAPDKEIKYMIQAASEKGIPFKAGDIDIILTSRDMNILTKKLEYLSNRGIEFVTKNDSLYPHKLNHIYDPPFMLYYKGKPLAEGKKILSIVGARECSIYGREIAKYLAAAIAKEGVIVVSGLARGIDTYAHKGALSMGGMTYGIMGCGIDICYPLENIQIYMDMQESGGIISEYGPGVKPLAYHFPMRNRIISALSDGILVIEAREKSGSLITVDMGLEQGKNIYAVPGRINDRLSKGCNNLIKIGAKMVTTPEDILEDLLEYGYNQEGDQIKLKGILSQEEELIYELLSLSPKHLEEIVTLTGLELGKMMECLLSMELKDLIYQPTKNYYSKRQLL